MHLGCLQRRFTMYYTYNNHDGVINNPVLQMTEVSLSEIRFPKDSRLIKCHRKAMKKTTTDKKCNTTLSPWAVASVTEELNF